jgi:hypothetical protein
VQGGRHPAQDQPGRRRVRARCPGSPPRPAPSPRYRRGDAVCGLRALGGIMAHLPGMTRRLNVLTIQDGGDGAAGFGGPACTGRRPGPPTSRIASVAGRYDVWFSEEKVRREITSRDAALNHIQNGIRDLPMIGWGPSALGCFGKHGY